MEARDILIKPIVTEKTMKQQSDLNQVTFYVKKGVNKIEIAKAVEEIYNVKVTSVNVIVTPEKKKRVGRYYGRTTEKRKAIVTLAEGDWKNGASYLPYSKTGKTIGRNVLFPDKMHRRKKWVLKLTSLRPMAAEA